ncbi:MAG: DUF7520 family protein [Halobacteriota archaeon]
MTKPQAGLGRKILIGVGVSVVAIGGVLGGFVGAVGADQVSEIEIFGVLTVPMTPIWMALYGMIATAIVLGVLFGAVELASRYESVDDRS